MTSKLTAADFTQQPAVQETLQQLREYRDANGLRVSDVFDDEGRQYVDLVLEGGGVLGIGLAGYTYCLEEMDIRFLSVAGTSAGAINALLIAASDKPRNKKSDTIIEEIANLDLGSLVDGHIFTKMLIWVATRKMPLVFKVMLGALPAIPVFLTFIAKKGLNPGGAFHKWLTAALQRRNIQTNEDLEKRMQPPPDLLRIDRTEQEDWETDETDTRRGFRPRMALISAELHTRSKVSLPSMARLFYADPNAANPADFARASMSVPFFFRPFIRDPLPPGKNLQKEWDDMAGIEKGEYPTKAMFVDGGVLSNFPIYIFHDYHHIPRAPTFGAKLGVDRKEPAYVDGNIEIVKAIFRSMRQILDFDFLVNNDEYEMLIGRINTGPHHWLNFELSEEAKKELFLNGVKAAARFLQDFKWKEYKRARYKRLNRSAKRRM